MQHFVRVGQRQVRAERESHLIQLMLTRAEDHGRAESRILALCACLGRQAEDAALYFVLALR